MAMLREPAELGFLVRLSAGERKFPVKFSRVDNMISVSLCSDWANDPMGPSRITFSLML